MLKMMAGSTNRPELIIAPAATAKTPTNPSSLFSAIAGPILVRNNPSASGKKHPRLPRAGGGK